MEQIQKLCCTPKSAKELVVLLGYKDIKHFKMTFLKPMVEKGILEYTNKEFIQASNQKYVVSKNV